VEERNELELDLYLRTEVLACASAWSSTVLSVRKETERASVLEKNATVLSVRNKWGGSQTCRWRTSPISKVSLTPDTIRKRRVTQPPDTQSHLGGPGVPVVSAVSVDKGDVSLAFVNIQHSDLSTLPPPESHTHPQKDSSQHAPTDPNESYRIGLQMTPGTARTWPDPGRRGKTFPTFPQCPRVFHNSRRTRPRTQSIQQRSSIMCISGWESAGNPRRAAGSHLFSKQPCLSLSLP